MEYPSKLIEDAVNEFSRLPGIGKKTALRLVLHLLGQPEERSELFGNAIQRMRRDIVFCEECHNVSDHPICTICSDPGRENETLCIVENLRDVIAIENTRQYRGKYHVLGGVISPLDGVGPEELEIESLLHRVANHKVSEIIMALSPTLEGDTTIFYITKRLKGAPVSVTSIARGVAFGGELEFVDELTLARSIASRLPYESYLINK